MTMIMSHDKTKDKQKKLSGWNSLLYFVQKNKLNIIIN